MSSLKENITHVFTKLGRIRDYCVKQILIYAPPTKKEEEKKKKKQQQQDKMQTTTIQK